MEIPCGRDPAENPAALAERGVEAGVLLLQEAPEGCESRWRGNFALTVPFSDVLTHAATTMKLEQLLQVFPQSLSEGGRATEEKSSEGEAENQSYGVLSEIQNYEPYLVMCKETMHANQIKKLISATGQQLLCTLNL